MKRETSRPWLLPSLYALFVLIAWGFAALRGVPAPQTAGFARLWSAALDGVCGRGWTPFLGGALTLWVLLALLVALSPRLPWGDDSLRRDGLYLLILAFLTILPFVIAWQTGSSACSRGKSFFWQSVYIEV
ncbi:MAG: hypothetical protein D6755_11315, partial [Anaerolineae bacterium]